MSRWAVVVHDRFHWWPHPRVMVTKQRGEILHLNRVAMAQGLASGSIKNIPRPPGYKVNKSGQVERCSS